MLNYQESVSNNNELEALIQAKSELIEDSVSGNNSNKMFDNLSQIGNKKFH